MAATPTSYLTCCQLCCDDCVRVCMCACVLSCFLQVKATLRRYCSSVALGRIEGILAAFVVATHLSRCYPFFRHSCLSRLFIVHYGRVMLSSFIFSCLQVIVVTVCLLPLGVLSSSCPLACFVVVTVTMCCVLAIAFLSRCHRACFVVVTVQ